MENSLIYSSVLSIKVQNEISVSWGWYEERSRGLGDRFVKEVKGTVFKIEQHPGRYPLQYKNYRQASLHTFPFLVIFRVNERKKIVRIVSVFHTSQDPKKKYD